MSVRRSLCVFFSYPVSLETWRDRGFLSREIFYYRKLAEAGVKVGMVTYGGDRDLEIAAGLGDIEVMPLFRGRKLPESTTVRFLMSWFLAFSLSGKLRGYDIYKSNQMLGSWLPLFFGLLNRKHTVLRCGYEQHFTFRRKGKGTFFMGAFWIYSALAYRLADRVIVTTPSILDYVLTTFRMGADRFSVIPNFIDTGLFRPCKKPGLRRREALFVGRLSREKNLHLLIDVCAEVGVALNIAGDGSLERELREYARSRGADARFLGVVANERLPELMSDIDIFVLPSVYEGNPKALLEAMACACSVIASDIEGTRAIIQDGINGILCRNSKEGLAEGLREALADDGRRMSLGANARRYVEENCSVERVMELELSVLGAR